MNNWRETTLGKVAEIFTGYSFKSEFYSGGLQDIRLLRGDNISQGSMDWSDAKKWPFEQFKDFEDYQLNEDDIVLAMDRPWIGAGLKYSQIIKSDLPALLVQRTARLRGSSDLDIGYLKFIIGSPWFTSYIKRITTGSLVPHISLKQIREFPVKLPPFEEQKATAAVLQAVDKKIELNNRINTELETMAKTLYDYWFVQFDFPDANGKPYKTSGGKMVYNPTLKREIPDGWDWKPVSSLIEVKDGTHDSPKPSDKGQYLITSKHLKSTGIDFSDAYFISQEDFDAVNKRSKVDEGDFLLSMIGTVGLSQWAMKIETPYAIKNIGLFKTSQAPEKADYIFSAVTSLFGKAFLKQNQSTGTSQPYVTLGTLRSIPVVIPEKSVFNEFNKKIKPLHKLTYENSLESQKLAELRDWLLPMLMNGQVTVSTPTQPQTPEAQDG